MTTLVNFRTRISYDYILYTAKYAINKEIIIDN